MRKRSYLKWLAAGFLGGLIAVGCGSDDKTDEPKKDPEKRDAFIVSFQADKESVLEGESVTLSWITEYATEVRIVAGGQDIPLGAAAPQQGSVKVTVEKTTTYELIATGETGVDTTRSVEVKTRLPGEPGIVSFTAQPEQVLFGQTTTLSWEVLDAETLRIMEGEELVTESKSLESSVGVKPTKKTTYTLIAEGPGGSDSSSVTVTVEPLIHEFKVSPTVVEAEAGFPGDVTLSWRIEGAEDITIVADPGGELDLTGVVIGNGELKTQVEEPTTFTLTALGGDTSATATAEVTTESVPRITAYKAPEIVGTNDPFRISWASVNTSHVEVFKAGTSLGMKNSNGTLEDSIEEATTYKIVGVGTERSAEVEFTVKVGPPEIVSFQVSKERAAFGENVVLSWETKGATNMLLTERNDGEVEPPGEVQFDPDKGSVTLLAPAEAAVKFYELRIQNSDGVAVETASYGVGLGPLIWEFTREPERLPQDGEVTLSWKVERDDAGEMPTLELSDSAGNDYVITDLESSIDVVVDTAGSRTFTLKASTDRGSMEATATVVSVAPPTIDFTAVLDEDQVVFDWTCTNGVGLRIFHQVDSETEVEVFSTEQASEVASGTESVDRPSFPATYRAEVVNEFGVPAEQVVVVDEE